MLNRRLNILRLRTVSMKLLELEGAILLKFGIKNSDVPVRFVLVNGLAVDMLAKICIIDRCVRFVLPFLTKSKPQNLRLVYISTAGRKREESVSLVDENDVWTVTESLN